MKTLFRFCAAGAALLGAMAMANLAAAQDTPVLAITLAPAKNMAKLAVTSSDFQNGGKLADKFTQYGANMSPTLSWSAGPAGTQSYTLITEDAGVKRHDPIIHWVIYNIPAGTTSLPEHVSTDAHPANVAGAMNGLNQRGNSGFMGPKPPAGMTHPYHFQVFALDEKLDLDPAKANRMAVVNAMKGHVLASGQIVVNYTGK